jgi:hypothetical protein
MCKLCNTDRKPDIKRCILRIEYKEFKDIVYQYTGEYPCSNCLDNYRTHFRNVDSKTVDNYIIDKLKQSIVLTYSTQSQKNKWYRLMNKHKPRDVEPVATVDHCIRKIYNHFKVIVERNRIIYTKSFETLDEAIIYRNNLIVSLDKIRN